MRVCGAHAALILRHASTKRAHSVARAAAAPAPAWARRGALPMASARQRRRGLSSARQCRHALPTPIGGRRRGAGDRRRGARSRGCTPRPCTKTHGSGGSRWYVHEAVHAGAEATRWWQRRAARPSCPTARAVPASSASACRRRSGVARCGASPTRRPANGASAPSAGDRHCGAPEASRATQRRRLRQLRAGPTASARWLSHRRQRRCVGCGSDAKSTRNHPSEFLPASPEYTDGGRYCSANTTPELREATRGMSGTLITSTDAEALLAAVKRRAQHLRRPHRPHHHPRR